MMLTTANTNCLNDPMIKKNATRTG